MTRVPVHLRWPADRFYWSIVDAPGYHRTGPLPAGLWPAVAEDIPADPDTLHAVCAPIPSAETEIARVIVCAVERAVLKGLDADTLTPEQLPAGLPGVELGSLNLLVGKFEPESRQSERRRERIKVGAVVVLCLALVGVGLERRTGHWRAVARRARSATVALAERSGGSPEVMDLELSRLQLASVNPTARPLDASRPLASILASWPPLGRPLSITATGSSIGISISVEGDPGPFLEALHPPDGWRLEEPRIAAAGQVTRLTLELRRAP